MVLNKTYQSCLVKRIVDNDHVEALMALQDMIQDIKQNKVCIEDYEITTSIGRNYKNPECLQMKLKQAYEERGQPCPAGTRVGYIVGKVRPYSKPPRSIASKAVDCRATAMWPAK